MLDHRAHVVAILLTMEDVQALQGSLEEASLVIARITREAYELHPEWRDEVRRLWAAKQYESATPSWP